MKLTTSLLDNALSTARGTCPNQGVLALLYLFARSHPDNANIFPELHDAYREARRRRVFLTTFISTLVGSLVLILFATVKGLETGHVVAVALAALIGCVIVAFCCSLGSNCELKTEKRPALEKLRKLAEVIRGFSGSFEIYGVLVQSDNFMCIDTLKEKAKESARCYAAEFLQTESQFGDISPRTEEVRHRVYRLLFLLSSSGLIEKDWKKAYLGTKNGDGQFHHSPSDY